MLAAFSIGWSWSAAWKEAFSQLLKARHGLCGLCFDLLGHPWQRSDTQQACQQSFYGEVDGVAYLTTYSLRRYGRLEGWEGVTFPRAAQRVFRPSALAQWERTARVGTMAAPVMPDSVNGRVTASTLRNGMALCPLWQSARCANQHCSMAHLCATVLRSGRVCGGRHAAMDCLDKRRLTIAQAEDVGGSRMESSAREEPAVAAAARPRPSSVEASSASSSMSPCRGDGLCHHLRGIYP